MKHLCYWDLSYQGGLSEKLIRVLNVSIQSTDSIFDEQMVNSVFLTSSSLPLMLEKVAFIFMKMKGYNKVQYVFSGCFEAPGIPVTNQNLL